jgi:hypothetical protein
VSDAELRELFRFIDRDGRCELLNDAPCPPLTSHGASIMWQERTGSVAEIPLRFRWDY